MGYGICYDPVQEWGEEVEDGAIYGITLHREPIQPPPDAAENSSAFGFMQYRTQKVRRLKAATLERLVTELVNPECPDPDYMQIFLSTYRAFTCTNALMELLFQSVCVCVCSSLPRLIRLWLDEYQEDLRDSPGHQALLLLCIHLRHRLCFRRLVHQADALLKKFQTEGKPTFIHLLMFLSQELFVKVVPFHCLGCIWSQRDKKENRNLAPTVRATIAQFNAVTNCVITSLLAPTHRAKIIEKWISVAQECHQLRNFSSLRAILSALQSNAVYRLKKTWAAISSLAAFDHLCDTFPDENCVLVNRDILVELTLYDNSILFFWQTPSSGEVPYLGTYLTVLTMLDTALSDNVGKVSTEFEILSQIKQLQASCAHYKLQSHPHIISWINSGIPLSDQKSYELSRDLEPPVDPFSTHFMDPDFSKSIENSKKTFADQISVSSSGSSGSEMEDLSSPNLSPLRYKVQVTKLLSPFPHSQSVSCQDISVDTATSSLTPPSSFRRCLQADMSVLNPDSPSPTSSTSSSSSSSPSLKHPMYNKQVADSCIVRVSVEFGNNGNVYKSILITSQDKTAQVIQRALEKHNLEEMSCQEFSLTQVLSSDKELLIPDKANVFYAMCTAANFDFVLRQRYKNLGRAPGSSWSHGAVRRSRK
uniref:Ral guanine nucleotide dissociation stimulator-like 3a n=1 Tax=Cyprinus carpio TaxID=7962 RepID=A0A8C2JDW4_CYPCA